MSSVPNRLKETLAGMRETNRGYGTTVAVPGADNPEIISSVG